MKTYMQSKEDAIKGRRWVLIDAAGVPLGRLASQVAHLLRGKHKVSFTPHSDGGDFVVVVNAAKVKLTGSKLVDKLYRRYSGFIGGLKETRASDLLANKPEEVIRHAVKGMISKGPLGYDVFSKLKVYSGSEHPHKAQNPESYQIAL